MGWSWLCPSDRCYAPHAFFSKGLASLYQIIDALLWKWSIRKRAAGPGGISVRWMAEDDMATFTVWKIKLHEAT
jgi:hypothetical protein